MRHAFSFPEGIREALKNHIEKAVSGIDMKRYHQEPAYTSAVFDWEIFRAMEPAKKHAIAGTKD